MKIAIIQDCLRSGGTERQSILLANAFEARGMETTLVTFRPGGTLAGSLGSTRRITLQPFDTGLDWFAPGLVRRVRVLAPDIVLCMGRMANCHGLRLLHGVPQARIVGTMRTGKTLPFAYRSFLGKAHHVVANSREALDGLIADGVLQAAYGSVICNSLVFKQTAPSSETRARLRTQHGASRETTVLLNVGMFRPEKNQRELIRLCTQLPRGLDWQLWLAGDGPELGACARLAGELNLGDRVRFVGWHADPSPLYAAADLAVHASVSEALSNFLIEAQAHGLPCVAYQAQGNSECIVEGRTGFIIPRGDRARFCEAVQTLATEPAEARSSRSNRARAHARENFDEARQIDKYVDLFKSLAMDIASGKQG